jgi:hypothetical protein
MGVTWSSRVPREISPTNDLNLSAQSSKQPSQLSFLLHGLLSFIEISRSIWNLHRMHSQPKKLLRHS